MRSTEDNSDSNNKAPIWSTEDISDAEPVFWDGQLSGQTEDTIEALISVIIIWLYYEHNKSYSLLYHVYTHVRIVCCQSIDQVNVTYVMLGLHYVPGGYGGHVCPKRSAPWEFSPLSIFVRSCYVS